MADVSKVKINNTTYDVKDETARTDLATKAPLASPALTGTPTAPTATSGTSTTQIATTAFAKGEADKKVSKSGDTMTGNIGLISSDPGIIIKNTVADATANSINVAAHGSIMVKDKNDNILSYFQMSEQTDGQVSAIVGSRRKYNGNDVSNVVSLIVNKNGVASVLLTHPSAWRDALELNDSGWLALTNATKFTGTVHYRKIGSIVSVTAYDITLQSGLTAGNGTSIAKLPSGYFQPKNVTFPIRWHSDLKSATGLIAADGTIYVYAPDGTAVTTSSTLCFTMIYFID